MTEEEEAIFVPYGEAYSTPDKESGDIVEEETSEPIELRARLENRERTIEMLRKEILSLKGEIVLLKKRLGEPVVLTERGIQNDKEVPEGMTAAHAIKALRERGIW